MPNVTHTMIVLAALLGMIVAAIFFIGGKQPEPSSEEVVRTPSMAIARLAGTTAALMSLEYDWKRSGEGAVANFSVHNANDFEVTSFEIKCYLFDKGAKPVGEHVHEVRAKLAANAKASLDVVRIVRVEAAARTAICIINDAFPRVSR